jgi:hypothetical protein
MALAEISRSLALDASTKADSFALLAFESDGELDEEEKEAKRMLKKFLRHKAMARVRTESLNSAVPHSGANLRAAHRSHVGASLQGIDASKQVAIDEDVESQRQEGLGDQVLVNTSNEPMETVVI